MYIISAWESNQSGSHDLQSGTWDKGLCCVVRHCNMVHCIGCYMQNTCHGITDWCVATSVNAWKAAAIFWPLWFTVIVFFWVECTSLRPQRSVVMLQSHCACGFVSCVPVIISTCDCVFVWLRECVYIYIFWKAAHAVPLVLNSAATSQPILNTGRSTHPPTALSPCQSLSLSLCFSLPDRDHALDMDMALLSFRVWCLFVSVVMCIILLISPYITAWYKQCTFPANLTSCHHVGPLSALIRRFVINWPVPPVVF